MDHFSPVLPVVVNLRNQGLQERHWEQIHELIGFEIKGRPEITLGELIDKKVPCLLAFVMVVLTRTGGARMLYMNFCVRSLFTCDLLLGPLIYRQHCARSPALLKFDPAVLILPFCLARGGTTSDS